MGRESLTKQLFYTESYHSKNPKCSFKQILNSLTPISKHEKTQAQTTRTNTKKQYHDWKTSA